MSFELWRGTPMAEEKVNSGRRRVPRRSFDGQVGVLLHGKYILERASQVGEGGMMITCSSKIKEGTLLLLSFYLPSGVIITVRGAVRNVVKAKGALPERYGIEFLNLDFQYKREIRNFVAAATEVDGQLVSL